MSVCIFIVAESCVTTKYEKLEDTRSRLLMTVKKTVSDRKYLLPWAFDYKTTVFNGRYYVVFGTSRSDIEEKVLWNIYSDVEKGSCTCFPGASGNQVIDQSKSTFNFNSQSNLVSLVTVKST